MTASQTRGQDQAVNTGKTGNGLIRFRIVTQLDSDALHLKELFLTFIENSRVCEIVLNSSGKNWFIFEFPEQEEDRVERLIGYSGSIVSYHLEKKGA